MWTTHGTDMWQGIIWNQLSTRLSLATPRMVCAWVRESFLFHAKLTVPSMSLSFITCNPMNCVLAEAPLRDVPTSSDVPTTPPVISWVPHGWPKYQCSESHTVSGTYARLFAWTGSTSFGGPVNSVPSSRALPRAHSVQRHRWLPGPGGGHRLELRLFAKSLLSFSTLCSPSLFSFQSTSCTLRRRVHLVCPAAWTRRRGRIGKVAWVLSRLLCLWRHRPGLTCVSHVSEEEGLTPARVNCVLGVLVRSRFVCLVPSSFPGYTRCRVGLIPGSQSLCEREVIVIRPHLLGESAQDNFYLTSGKLKGRRKCWKIKMKKRRNVKLVKRSRKSERTLNSCMRHGDDHVME